MTLENIRLRGFTEPDRDAVEKAVIARVQANPEHFLAAYLKHPDSFGGRYVCADAFKELFDEFNASREARNRFNGPVHNAAAVLSAEAFKRSIADTSDPGRNEVIFLTGIPGAGKTSSILADGGLPPTWRTVFEGQMSNPATAIPKIQEALDRGLNVSIIAVHTLPETALNNTFKRFSEYGRGASMTIMSEIQSELPNGLESIKQRFQQNVNLTIIDRRDINETKVYKDWSNLDVLASEGNREAVKGRLERHLEHARDSGRISNACYQQAGGRVRRDERLVGESKGEPNPDGERRSLPSGDRKADLLKTGNQYWTSVAAGAQPPKDNSSLSLGDSAKPKPKLKP